MTGVWGERLRRGLGRSPAELARRLAYEAAAQADRWRGAPADGLSADSFARRFGAADLDALWQRMLARPFAVPTAPMDSVAYEALCPGDAARIAGAAAAARARTVDLLGSGPVTLGDPVAWRRDFVSGLDWPAAFFRDIDVVDAARPSDIRVPWELSRLHWLIPVGQAHLLAADEGGAAFVRGVLDDWIAANPYARGPNWAVAMEAALRIVSWGWLFHVFGATAAWAEPDFRHRFLAALHGHGAFVARHLEDFGTGGNHLIADAAGLVVAGQMFGGKDGEGDGWAETGWRLLVRELPRQVTPDGAGYEASAAYHRLVAELYVLAAAARRASGGAVEAPVLARLGAMAAFTAATARPDGLAPLWGDGDDGRVLPFGGQAVGDHSYLPALIAALGVEVPALRPTAPAVAELAWALGPEAAVAALPGASPPPASAAFADAGVYVLRGEGDHVFVDAGPVGLGGLGGHGHNDCLGFEAVLDGVPLVADSGTFAYTGDLAARDAFRGTAAHSTPMVGEAEQNAIPAGEPFRLADDAVPSIEAWRPGPAEDLLIAAHAGYARLDPPAAVRRAFLLDKAAHVLIVADRVEGSGGHGVHVPFHLAPGVAAEEAGEGAWRLEAGGKTFVLAALESEGWQGALGQSDISPSYGVRRPRAVIAFAHAGVPAALTVVLAPATATPAELRDRLAAKAASIWD